MALKSRKLVYANDAILIGKNIP